MHVYLYCVMMTLQLGLSRVVLALGRGLKTS